jgi:uncharacterized membrane protein
MNLDRVRQLMYYFIIGIVSLIALCFLPMIGSNIGLGWNVPNTVVGWIVWGVVKCIVATLNVLIFHCFMCQARLNIKDNERYIEAQDILRQQELKEYIPRSPSDWNKQQYSTKGITIFITTALSTIALTQALLQFDYITMLTYLFTIVMGLIFGVMQMKAAEDYWTDEFWQYAKRVAQKQVEMAESESNKQRDTDIHDNRGTDILDSSVGTGDSSDSGKPVVVECVDSSNSLLGGPVYPSNITTNSLDNGA